LSASSEDQILQLQAVTVMQTADVSSLLSLLIQIHAVLLDHVPQLHGKMPEVAETFLKRRKQLLHAQLEKLEETSPGLAARIQQQIDSMPMQYPFDYGDDEV
jgi:hypothetical protein